MRRFVPFVLVILSIFLMGCGGGPSTDTHDGIPFNCEYSHGAYYRPNLFPRFELNNQRLLLVDWSTGEIVYELATSVGASSIEDVYMLNWSPDCRYLAMYQKGSGVLWDTTTGELVGQFSDLAQYDRRFIAGHDDDRAVTWDPTSSAVTVQSGGHTYLENVSTRNIVQVSDQSFDHEIWDTVRRELIGVSKGEINAYSVDSGAMVAQFGALPLDSWVVFSPDHRYLAFYRRYFPHAESEILNVFDRDTMQRTDIYVGHYWSALLDGTIAFSPNNRFIAIAENNVSVWDLQNPPQDITQRSPAYQLAGHDSSYWSEIQFVDNAVLSDGRQYWNIFTGEQVVR